MLHSMHTAHTHTGTKSTARYFNTFHLMHGNARWYSNIEMDAYYILGVLWALGFWCCQHFFTMDIEKFGVSSSERECYFHGWAMLSMPSSLFPLRSYLWQLKAFFTNYYYGIVMWHWIRAARKTDIFGWCIISFVSYWFNSRETLNECWMLELKAIIINVINVPNFSATAKQKKNLLTNTYLS